MTVERPREIRVKLSDEEDRLLTEAARGVCAKSELLRRAFFGFDPDTAPRTRPKRGREVGPYRCLVPDCAAPPLKNMDTFYAHVRRFHAMPMADYRTEYGDPQVLSVAEAAEDVSVSCPEGCGQVYSTATGTRWPHAAMIAHMRGHHGKVWP